MNASQQPCRATALGHMWRMLSRIQHGVNHSIEKEGVLCGRDGMFPLAADVAFGVGQILAVSPQDREAETTIRQ